MDDQQSVELPSEPLTVGGTIQECQGHDDSQSQVLSEVKPTVPPATTMSSFTEQMISESVMSQYHTLMSQQAQAAAAMMILGPSAAVNRDTTNVHRPLPSYHTLTKAAGQTTKPAEDLAPRSTAQQIDLTAHMTTVERSDSVGQVLVGPIYAPQIPHTAAAEGTEHSPKKLPPRRRSAKDREEKYKCTMCPYRSKWSHGLSNHMRTHNNTVFKCGECDYSTPWKGDLKNHERVHTGNLFECDQCEFKSYRKQGLEKHVILHTGDKPFTCSECSYSTSQPGNLKKHMMRHTGEKPISCDICTYRCRQSSQLRQHIQHYHNDSIGSSSSRERSWPGTKVATKSRHHCSLCGHSWASKQSYTRHMYSQHSTNRPYKCGYVCYRTFSTSQEMERHRTTHAAGVNADIPKVETRDASTSTELPEPVPSDTQPVSDALFSEPQEPPPQYTAPTSSVSMYTESAKPTTQYPEQEELPSQYTDSSNQASGFLNQSDQPTSYINQSNQSNELSDRLISYDGQLQHHKMDQSNSPQHGSYNNQSIHTLQSVDQSALLIEPSEVPIRPPIILSSSLQPISSILLPTSSSSGSDPCDSWHPSPTYT